MEEPRHNEYARCAILDTKVQRQTKLILDIRSSHTGYSQWGGVGGGGLVTGRGRKGPPRGSDKDLFLDLGTNRADLLTLRNIFE